MRNKLLSIILCCCAIGAAGQRRTLKFNADGKFKIVQFTDVHYVPDNPKSEAALENIGETIEAERPDLVVFTGDVIFGKPADRGMREVLGTVAEKGIPFAVTFGNHDHEHGMSRRELLRIIASHPHNLTATTEGISGVTNYILKVQSARSDKTAAALYVFDSGDYSKIEGVDGYDYIKSDQVDWYRRQSAALAEGNGGTPVRALAFFHIPLPEFKEAAAAESAHLFGTRMEAVCSPKLNSGLFTAMKEMDDVQAMFVGHDHDNDYMVQWCGIGLAYGRYSGGDTVYNNLKPNGARVIELTEGSGSFRTYIRLHGGAVVNDIVYPDYFTDQKD